MIALEAGGVIAGQFRLKAISLHIMPGEYWAGGGARPGPHAGGS